MAHRVLRDYEADGWERSDFPIICESCLGDNPYVRMTKADYDKECKICTRPFTVFRWRPGRDARHKKTEICQTCSKLKNVCQVCLLDLEYGLPVQVRDTALSITSHDAIPKSDVNKEYFAEEHDRRARAGIDYESSYGKVRPNDTILKLQRTTPYYKRNRAHICSFYVRGECTRGAECPYRHEMPETGELSQQNIKDRYYGVNDPVAMKLLGKAGEMTSVEPPEDESIKTLYVGGIDGRITEQDLRDNFYAYGEIESVKMKLDRACGFVTYTTREGAEKAVEELSNKLVIKGMRLKLTWVRPQAPKPEGESSGQQVALTHGGLLPRAVISQQQNQSQDQPLYNMPPPPYQQEKAYYPSMDPQRMGAVAASSQEGGSSENKSGPPQPGHNYAYPSMPMPAHGQYHQQQYYQPPAYGYMQQPPPPQHYQQYPPQYGMPPPMIHHQYPPRSAPPASAPAPQARTVQPPPTASGASSSAAAPPAASSPAAAPPAASTPSESSEQ
ncbi:hypothetical protein ACFE04_013087 [Oxalis oulophora]